MRRDAPPPLPRPNPFRRLDREVRRLASLDGAAAAELALPLEGPEQGGSAGQDDGAGRWAGYGMLDFTPLQGDGDPGGFRLGE